MCKSYTDMGGRKMANYPIHVFKSLQKVWRWVMADPTHTYTHTSISEQINPLFFALHQARSVTVEDTAELLDN